MATQPGQDRIIGIDIGGTGIKGALVDVKAGKLAASRARLSTPQPATPIAVAKTVGEVLEQIDADGPVGLTLPAVVRGGTVETASNVDHEWTGTDAVDLFSRTTGRLSPW
jgi:polyphosphate glucokinase